MNSNETQMRFSAQNAAIMKMHCDDKQKLQYSVV